MTVSAIVLCGGLSSRMGQLTSNTPKSLLKVNKRPIIWYTIGFLYKNGIKKFIFPLGYKGEKIKKYLIKEFSQFDIDLIFCDTGKTTPIHLRIKKVFKYLEDNTDFVLINSDTIFKFNLENMYKTHIKNQDDITLSSVPVTSPWGIITTNDNNVVGFERDLKVKNLEIISNRKVRGEVYSGLCIIKKKCLNSFDWENCCDFETYLFNKYIQNGSVSHFQINGTWYPIDTPKHLDEINSNVSNILVGKAEKYFQIT